MTSTAVHALTTTPAAATSRPSADYGRQISLILNAAFALSLLHTVYAEVVGIAAPDFTVRTPVTWAFYAVAFGSAALARRPERWAQRTLVAYLAALLSVAVFYYPTTFEPHQQTTFGWFENDVYVGLLVLAAYLAVQRLRHITLSPA